MQIKQTKNVKTTNKQTNKQQHKQTTKRKEKKKQKGENALQNTIKMESISLKINPCPQIPCDFEMCQGH